MTSVSLLPERRGPALLGVMTGVDSVSPHVSSVLLPLSAHGAGKGGCGSFRNLGKSHLDFKRAHKF